MNSYKPGAVGGKLPGAMRPRWFNAPKDEQGKVARPDQEPPAMEHAPTHYEVGPGAGVVAPAALPNKRGKGGRPTKAQARDEGKSPAQEAIAKIRETDPKTLQIPPRRKSWEKDYNERELTVEQEEAEAVLTARQDRVKALNAEAAVLAANRKIAMGFSSVALHGLRVMSNAMTELGAREVKDQTVGELQKTITTVSSAVGKAQSAIECMARAERWIMRHPLDIEEDKGDDLDDLDADGARQILENLKGQIDNTVRLFAKKPIVAESPGEEVLP